MAAQGWVRAFLGREVRVSPIETRVLSRVAYRGLALLSPVDVSPCHQAGRRRLRCHQAAARAVRLTARHRRSAPRGHASTVHTPQIFMMYTPQGGRIPPQGTGPRIHLGVYARSATRSRP